MAIHIRVVTPITTQGFRSPEDASQLESDGVKVDFVNIETGPASIECNYEINCRSWARSPASSRRNARTPTPW
jgi:hypothetical protein